MSKYASCLLYTLLVISQPAAALVLFSSSLTASQELTPPAFTTATGAPRPASFGTATLILSDDMKSFSFTVTVHNIDVNGTQTPDSNDNLVNAHIHAPAAPGANAGVKFGFFGTPFNDTSPTDLVVTPFATGVGGTFFSKWDEAEGNSTTLTAQIPDLLAELAYLNFHTVQNPGGEIRGQILRVPEPGSLSLLMIALAGLGVSRGICRIPRSTR